jgi:hypothetical protein
MSSRKTPYNYKESEAGSNRSRAIVKQFIRNVRAAKTIADERAVVQKESAAIRASFREESHDSNIRYNNLPLDA